MFIKLTELCAQEGIQVSGFWTSHPLDSTFSKVLKMLAVKINWDCYKMKNLLARIKKIGKRAESFSAREVKLLRKLINQQKKEGFTDFQRIAYYFPGKTVETLEKKYNEKYDYLKNKKVSL